MIGIQTYIKDRFNIKDDDYNKIKLLFLYSFFLGFFIAFYFVPANSNFLSNYGHWELPFAYVISGVVGISAISFYSLIQRKRRSKTLFLTAILLMLFISLFARLMIFLLEKQIVNDLFVSNTLLIKYLSFFVFIWAWPFIALVATITGGLALRLFNLLQVKKFYGLINLGGVVAATVSYFLISQLLKLLNSSYDLIVIGSFGLIGAIILLLYIYKKFPEKRQKTVKIEQIDTKKIFGGLLKDKFIFFIFLSAAISAIAIYIVDYGFLITVKANTGKVFSDDNSVAKFLSLVYGGLKVGEFIISLLSGRILTKGGVKWGLLLLPITITLLFVLGLIDGQITGYASVGFLTIMTANKMLERIVRRGVDDPAFNVLYQTMPDERKLFIQTRVGVVQQGSIAVAGLFLLLVNIFLRRSGTEFKLQLYPIYALPLLFFALFIAIRLYKKYKNRIKEILAEKKIFVFDYKEKDIFANDTVKMFVLSEDLDASKFSTIVLAETNPRSLETYAAFLLKVDDLIIRKAVLSNIDSTYSEKLIPIIEKVGDSISIKNKELKKLFLKAFFKLDYSEISDLSKEQIVKMAYSTNSQQNITATKYLFRHEFDGDEALILHLLNSEDKTVKFAAIKIAGKRKKRELWLKLIEMLANQEFNNMIINILVEIGEPVLSDLNKFFKKQTDYDIIAKTLQIFAKIGTSKAQRILVSYLNFSNREVQHLVILSLQYSAFRAREDTFEAIRNKIRSVVENIVWFLVSIKDVVREKNTLRLLQALDLERINSLEELFILLSFTQSPEIIELIKINIIGENTIFALELIDNFIDPEIKKIILPLFEPISLGQKIKKFRQLFYHKPIGFQNRLIDIILTSSSRIDIWSQAKALEVISKNTNITKINIDRYKQLPINQNVEWTDEFIEKIKSKLSNINLVDTLIISLLHPSELIYTTAMKALFDRKVDNLASIISNLPERKQKVFAKMQADKDIITDKIRLLRRVYLFYSIPEKYLTKLADIVRKVSIKKDEEITFVHKNQESVLILVKGKLQYQDKNATMIQRKNSVIVKGLNVPQKAEKLIAIADSEILAFNRSKFFNMLASYNQIVINLYKTMRF